MKKIRYSRQTNFYGFGDKAQDRLAASHVTIVGAGGLGSVVSEQLVREGVGFIRIIDSDIVEECNLHRQFLYTEQDAKKGARKAEAAAEYLKSLNRDVTIEPVTGRLTPENGEDWLKNADLVIDATDNMETRYLINEICVKLQIPWIYGGVVEAEGMTMTFLPGKPCFTCLTGASSPALPKELRKTCATAGVVNSAVAVTGSLQALEAAKFLTGSPSLREGLLHYRLWENEIWQQKVEKLKNCPICREGNYHYLNKE